MGRSTAALSAVRRSTGFSSQKSQEKQYFTILNNEDVVKMNMTNEKMEVVVPDTLKNNYLGTILESIILLSSGIIIYEKKNY